MIILYPKGCKDKMTDKIKCRIKKLLKIAGTVIAVLISVAAAILCLSIGWMFDTWSNLSMDELMYHLTAPLEGTNMGMVKEYINLCIAPAILEGKEVLYSDGGGNYSTACRIRNHCPDGVE